jgi:hypothetical protein
MPTATYTPLATVTLGSAASSVTFSSIPATYRDLILISSVRLTTGGAAGSLVFRANGDTGNNYSWVYMEGNGSLTASASNSSANLGVVGQAESSSTSAFGVGIAQFMDYAATNKHKTVLARADAPSLQTQAWVSRWANTAAINSLLIFSSQSMVAGSTFSLYGVIA